MVAIESPQEFESVFMLCRWLRNVVVCVFLSLANSKLSAQNSQYVLVPLGPPPTVMPSAFVGRGKAINIKDEIAADDGPQGLVGHASRRFVKYGRRHDLPAIRAGAMNRESILQIREARNAALFAGIMFKMTIW